MLVRAAAVLLLVACAGASVWRSNFVVDRLLHSVDVDVIPMHDIAFDRPNRWPVFNEFYLEKGTLGNLRRRVRRMEDCSIGDYTHYSSPHFYIKCVLSFAGLVAKYNVEAIVDERSTLFAAEVFVDSGSIVFGIDSHLGECTKCTKYYRFDVGDVTARLKPLRDSLELPEGAIEQFRAAVVPRAVIEIAHALNTTYKEALGEKMATLKPTDFTG